MTREERLRILGADTFEQAEREGRQAAAKFPPSPEVIVRLRLILTSPAADAEHTPAA